LRTPAKRGAKPANGLPGTWEYPIANHGKPVKIQPRSHSKTTQLAGKASPKRQALCAVKRAAKAVAKAGNNAKKAQNKKVAKAAKGQAIWPNSCRLIKTHETPARK
jgi:hypothetical protein